jgi:hypothetical protein
MAQFSRSTAATCSASTSRTMARATGRHCCPGSRDCCASRALPDDGEIVHAVLPARFRLCLQPGQLLVLPQPRRRADRRARRGQQHLRRHATATCCTTRTAHRCATGQEMRADKAFHVSPFNEVEGGYRFRFHVSDRKCPVIRIDYDDAEGELLLTAISGKSAAWSAGPARRLPAHAAPHCRRGVPHPLAGLETLAQGRALPSAPAPSHDHQPLQESPK